MQGLYLQLPHYSSAQFIDMNAHCCSQNSVASVEVKSLGQMLSCLISCYRIIYGTDLVKPSDQAALVSLRSLKKNLPFQ